MSRCIMYGPMDGLEGETTMMTLETMRANCPTTDDAYELYVNLRMEDGMNHSAAIKRVRITNKVVQDMFKASYNALCAG